MQGVNYVIFSTRLESPVVGYQSKPGGAGRNEVILCHYERNLGTQKHLWPIHHNENSRRDNKSKRIKGAMEGQKLMRTLDANATLMQRKCIRGALALDYNLQGVTNNHKGQSLSISKSLELEASFFLWSVWASSTHFFACYRARWPNR